MHTPRGLCLTLLVGASALAAADAGPVAAEPIDATEGCTEFRKLLAHLDHPARGELVSYFFLGPLDRTDVPARNGYLIGWNLAREMGRSRTLPELARLPPAQVHAEEVRWLQAFAGAADGGAAARR